MGVTMNRARILDLSILSVTGYLLLSTYAVAGDYVPRDGFVPDGETAIRIAEAVLVPIYGAKEVARERPFHPVLSDNTWTVRGTLPKGWVGGVAVIQIDKRDARVTGVSHGK